MLRWKTGGRLTSVSEEKRPYGNTKRKRSAPGPKTGQEGRDEGRWDEGSGTRGGGKRGGGQRGGGEEGRWEADGRDEGSDGKMKAKWEEDGCEEGGRVGRVVGGREVANEDCHLEGESSRQRQRTAPLW